MGWVGYLEFSDQSLSGVTAPGIRASIPRVLEEVQGWLQGVGILSGPKPSLSGNPEQSG